MCLWNLLSDIFKLISLFTLFQITPFNVISVLFLKVPCFTSVTLNFWTIIFAQIKVPYVIIAILVNAENNEEFEQHLHQVN